MEEIRDREEGCERGKRGTGTENMAIGDYVERERERSRSGRGRENRGKER